MESVLEYLPLWLDEKCRELSDGSLNTVCVFQIILRNVCLSIEAWHPLPLPPGLDGVTFEGDDPYMDKERHFSIVN